MCPPVVRKSTGISCATNEAWSLGPYPSGMQAMFRCCCPPISSTMALKLLLVPVPDTLMASPRIRPTISRFTMATKPLLPAGRLMRRASSCFIQSKKNFEPTRPCSSAPKKAKTMLRFEPTFLKYLANWSTTASPLALSSAPG